MNERLKALRKALCLSQEAFGEQIGLKGSSVSYIESGRNALTEQNIKAICREYNVSYIWLTQGAGEMFEEKSDDIVSLIDKVLGNENPTAVALFKAFAELDDSDWTIIQKIIDNLKK